MTQEPIAYINVEKRTLEFAKKIFWHTPTVANLDRIPLFTKEALAQPEESQSALSLFQSGFIDGREKGLKEALAQTQEPVAWVVYSSAENDIVWADKGKRLKQNTPLYTTPSQPEQEPVKMVAYNCTCGRTMKFESVHGVVAPQRKPLTDEEIEVIAKNYALNNPTTPLHFARAIEAAHNIKE